MQVEWCGEGRWVVRFTHTIDLAEPGVLDRLRPVLQGDCRHLLLDLSDLSNVSLLEADSLYVVRAAALATGAVLAVLTLLSALGRRDDEAG